MNKKGGVFGAILGILIFGVIGFFIATYFYPLGFFLVDNLWTIRIGIIGVACLIGGWIGLNYIPI